MHQLLLARAHHKPVEAATLRFIRSCSAPLSSELIHKIEDCSACLSSKPTE